MRVQRLRRAVALLLILAGTPVLGVDFYGLIAAPAAHADAVVVMGCAPNDDGTLSDCLKRRVDRGVALLQEGRADSLVLTGGELHGLEAEARVAARYALKRGAPGKAIVLEPFSQNTWENARNTLSLARPKAVIVVTDTSHVLRATACFSRLGVATSASGVVESSRSRRFFAAVRELFALGDYWLRDRLADPKRPPSAAPT